MSNQGHWQGLVANTNDYFGFIYIIRDKTTGRAYIGKKQFWIKKPKACRCKTAVADKQSPKWKPSCWKESDWRAYKGSSKHLAKYMKDNPKNDYEFEILRLCRSRGILTYSEVQEQWIRGVLHTLLDGGDKDGAGNFRYWNRRIGAMKYRPPEYCSEVTRAKLSQAGFGRKHTDETKAKLRERVHTPEAKAKISAANKGRPFTKEHRANMSKAAKERPPVSQEYKNKQGLASRDKTVYQWRHLDGRTFKGMRFEFHKEYSEVTDDGISCLIRGKQKTHFGWKLQHNDTELLKTKIGATQ